MLLPGKDADNVFDKHLRTGMIPALAWPSVTELAGRPVGGCSLPTMIGWMMISGVTVTPLIWPPSGLPHSAVTRCAWPRVRHPVKSSIRTGYPTGA